MKTITIDFSKGVPRTTTRYAGELGEHQAVRLKVVPEINMTEDEDIAFFYLLFAVEGGLVASRTYEPYEEITCDLWGQLTEQRNLKFQLIGTNGAETIIAKSPIVNLMIGDSLDGTVIGIDDNRDSLIAMIGEFNGRLDTVEDEIAHLEAGGALDLYFDAVDDEIYTLNLTRTGFDEDFDFNGNTEQAKEIKNEALAIRLHLGDEDYDVVNRDSENGLSFICLKSVGSSLVFGVYDYSFVSTPSGGVSTLMLTDETVNGITTAEKTKLAGIEAGAEVNVQPDWSQTDSSAEDYIKNKIDPYTKAEVDGLIDDVEPVVIGSGGTSYYTPAELNALFDRPLFWNNYPIIYRRYYGAARSFVFGVMMEVETGGMLQGFELKLKNVSQEKVITDYPALDPLFVKLGQEVFTTALKNKLDSLVPQAQADWNEADSSASDYIKNKPTDLSDFNNDEGFITEYIDLGTQLSLDYSWSEIEAMIGKPMTLDGGLVIDVEDRTSSSFGITIVKRDGTDYIFSSWSYNKSDASYVGLLSSGLAVTSIEKAKLNGGAVAQGNTKFVTGGQVYDAIQQGGGGSTVYVGDTEPQSATEGTLWVDTDDNYVEIPNGNNMQY